MEKEKTYMRSQRFLRRYDCDLGIKDSFTSLLDGLNS
jgi:hypothetical protein